MKPSQSPFGKTQEAASPTPATQQPTDLSADQNPVSEPAASRPGSEIPPILLEGDALAVPSATGPGEKFALGSAPVMSASEKEERVLPSSYGTGRVLLAARDPYCLYAHWDANADQQHQSEGHHLQLRVHPESGADQYVTELHVQPESRHWFISVPHSGEKYRAELGFFQPDGQWRRLAASEAVITPAAGLAEDKTVRFATLPVPAAPQVAPPPPTPLPQPTPQHMRALPAEQPLFQAPISLGPPPLLRLQSQPFAPTGAQPLTPEQPQFDWPSTFGPQPEVENARDWPEGLVLLDCWTPAQQQALARIIWQLLLRHEWLSSAEFLEPFSQQAQDELPPVLPSSLPPSVSSPLGDELPQPQPFWFNVKAELVIYGAAEPGAHVTVGGRPIQLRPDGTFSYRFALPDGQYLLTLTAVSAHGDMRQATLRFLRGTEYRGEVGTQPQDPGLSPPPDAA